MVLLLEWVSGRWKEGLTARREDQRNGLNRLDLEKKESCSADQRRTGCWCLESSKNWHDVIRKAWDLR